jgi:heme/copper-type cytochrome/quinol oxidase subunit 3
MLFNLSDGIFASLFYFITTTHGVHVVVGLIFLGISLVLFNLYAFDGVSSKPLMLECSAIYWHFVDIVWLFVWSYIYPDKHIVL